MLYHDEESYPLAGSISRRDILAYPWPDPADPVRRRGLKDQVRRLRASGDFALVLNLPSAFVHVTQYLRGFEDWFVDIMADRPLFELLADAVLEVNLAACAEILDEVGGEVDVAMCSDDLGMQGGLMVSPECYREVIKPRHRRYFDLVHAKSPAKVFFHTCGAVSEIIEDLIEIGVDVLHPVQVSAAGMDPETLKERFGRRLAFWGAVDTQRLLPHGSVEEVRAEVSRLIDVLGRGGGYVLGAVHNVQPDVPVANLLAMYEQGRGTGVG
jgi:uroporphyrinogen decarboxylase